MSESTTIKVRVTRELKKQLEKAAAGQVRTVSNLASIFLQEGVAHLFEDRATSQVSTRAKGVAHLKTSERKGTKDR